MAGNDTRRRASLSGWHPSPVLVVTALKASARSVSVATTKQRITRRAKRRCDPCSRGADQTSMLTRYLPFLDLRTYQRSTVRRDLLASASVTFLDIPQGVAYAMIAGLPPAMGLYAAAVPAIVGALFRSSRHVVTGPTNALSLLVGSAVAAEAAREGATPMDVGITLALMVGTMQFLAGLLRLDAIADYISYPVV